ncbi:unnamed protein product [Aphanomyces euteiches]|uniref:Uncharacterized protein n=1 Tax=Aphanomyces euteiches TaxID=100861 RepID=A0A6G0XFT5_9STRA|nr:hypothetical protein Ae201684_005510 [Aphanomyces euteiches]KAH9093020.1 hypothetical protein Ae201684P_008686 [Aphanomyces euteiches]KAH9143264.1 hypothetical protein AeRB84_012714 [Aphanomyces euteiches]
MEENSLEKPTETPSMRASRKSVAVSAPTRRSLRLKGDQPEYGLYEKPARNAKLAHLPQLEVEDKDSASSVVSLLGSSTSKREAEDDPDQSPQSQVPTKMPAVESPPQVDPSVIVIDDTDLDEEKSGQPETSPLRESESEQETKNQFDEAPTQRAMPEPRIEHAEDVLPLVPADQAKILARFSEIRVGLVPRISQQVLESATEIHRQGYESFLLQQQLDQSAEYRRYAEQLESERDFLRMENQQNHALISQVLEQCRINEEARIATFTAAMSHLQNLFDDRLRAWTNSIREAYELQLVEREKSSLWANTFFAESPEFQSGVQTAVMAERQTLQDQLTVIRRESEEVNRALAEAQRMLTQSKSESDLLERKVRGLEEKISSTEQEKENAIGSLTSSLHAQRAEHESVLVRIRAEYELYIQTTLTKSDPDLDPKSDPDVLRLVQENEVLLAERENLLQMKTDWESERRNMDEKVEELKIQHEDEVYRIRAAQSAERRQDTLDVSALRSRDQILSGQVERLSKDLTIYKNRSEQSEIKINQLQLALRSKEDLIRALETNLKLRSSPKNPNLANCQVCPGLKSKLEDSEFRIQTLIRDHAQELSEREAHVEHEWKEQCLKLEAVSFGALLEVENSHQKRNQTDEEISELTSAIRDLKAQINDKDALYRQLIDRYKVLSTTFKAIKDESTDMRFQLDEALQQLADAKEQADIEIGARESLTAKYEGQLRQLRHQLQARLPEAWTDHRH